MAHSANHKQPLPRGVLQLLHAVPDYRAAQREYDADMQPAVVQRADVGLVLLPEFALSFGHHGFASGLDFI